MTVEKKKAKTRRAGKKTVQKFDRSIEPEPDVPPGEDDKSEEEAQPEFKENLEQKDSSKKEVKATKIRFQRGAPCPNCGSTNTVSYHTEGKVQYRKCRVGSCRHSFSIIGEIVECE